MRRILLFGGCPVANYFGSTSTLCRSGKRNKVKRQCSGGQRRKTRGYHAAYLGKHATCIHGRTVYSYHIYCIIWSGVPGSGKAGTSIKGCNTGSGLSADCTKNAAYIY